MIEELDRIVLTKAVDGLDLDAGDVGTVVLVHEGGRGDAKPYSVRAYQVVGS